MAATQDAGRSFTANLVILDEWAFQQYAEEIYTSAYPTINRLGSGQVIGLSTAKRLTFYETMWKAAEAGKNKFKAIFLPWWTDPAGTRNGMRIQNGTCQFIPALIPVTAEEALKCG
jgi:hypothetical protein